MSAAAHPWTAFWRRVGAIVVKEFLQLRRDRITFATMIAIPLVQITLFGHAINTNPRDLPTAVLLQETSDVGRSILAALQNTKYFHLARQVHDVDELDRLLASGEILFAFEIPTGFERVLRRGDRPSLLVAADATDPVAVAAAFSALQEVVTAALRTTARSPRRRRRHSSSASIAATTRPARPSSISCPGCSAPY
jgi:ABC-2 type transport system permease protein